FFTTVHPTYYCNNCINRTYTLQYFLKIVLLIPHSLPFISLITTTNTYTCTFYILIISTLPTSTAASPNSVHITYLFLLYIYIYLFTYSTLHMHILCTFAILHFWLDAKLDFVASVLVLCAMTIKLNLKTNLKNSNL